MTRKDREGKSTDKGEELEKLYLLYKIRRGIQQAEAGQTVSHEEARERLKKWLTDT